MIIGFPSSSVKGTLVPSSETYFESDFFLNKNCMVWLLFCWLIIYHIVFFLVSSFPFYHFNYSFYLFFVLVLFWKSNDKNFHLVHAQSSFSIIYWLQIIRLNYCSYLIFSVLFSHRYVFHHHAWNAFKWSHLLKVYKPNHICPTKSFWKC
jgi:hypothetical protein